MVKKNYDDVKPFPSNTGTSRTDGQNIIAINIARHCADARLNLYPFSFEHYFLKYCRILFTVAVADKKYLPTNT